MWVGRDQPETRSSAMKSRLLITTALVSMLAGVGVASAQAPGENPRAAPGANAPAATEHGTSTPSQGAPKGAQSKGSESKSPTGGSAQQGSAPDHRMGQTEPKGK